MKFSKSLTLFACLFTLLTVGCKKDDVQPEPETEVTPLELECRYLEDLILTDRNPDGVDYVVNCILQYREGTLTIEPGVTIEFGTDAGLEIGTDAKVRASGTNAEPIILKGNIDGTPNWRGVSVFSRDAGNIFKHVRVQDAGIESFVVGLSEPAALVVIGSLSITNTTILNSANDGLRLWEGDARCPQFSMNVFDSNDHYPVYTNADLFGELDLASCLYIANGNQKIGMLANPAGGRIYNDATWVNPGLPIELNSNLRVLSDLVIEEGVQIEMGAGTHLAVESEGDEAKSLRIKGTEDDPVIIRGQVELAQSWNGLIVRSDNPLNIWEHLKVYHGGQSSMTFSNQSGNIQVDRVSSLTLSQVEAYEGTVCDVVNSDPPTVSLNNADSPNLIICD